MAQIKEVTVGVYDDPSSLPTSGQNISFADNVLRLNNGTKSFSIGSFPTQSAVPANFDGPAWFEDTGQTASYKNGAAVSGGDYGTVVLSPSDSAATNTAKIQAALDALGNVELFGDGSILINDTLVIRSNTKLSIGKNLELKLTAGASKKMLINAAYLTPYTPTSAPITVVGRVATIPMTGHPYVVGQAIDIQGVTERYYNGVFRVKSIATNSFTVDLYKTPNVTTSTGTPKVRAADENIELYGVTINYDRINQSFPVDTKDTMGAIFTSIFNFSSREYTAIETTKYGMLIGSVTNCFIQKSHFENTLDGSDGLHFNGPCYNVNVDDVTGLTGDDAVSFTIGDYVNWEVSRGDFVNVKVTNINPTYCNKSAVKYAGNAPYTVDNFVVDGVGGTYQLNGVLIYDDDVGGSLIGTNGETIILRNIGGVSLTGGKSVIVQVSGLIKNLEIDATYDKTMSTGVWVGNAVSGVPTYQNLSIKVRNDFDMPTPANSNMVAFGSFIAKNVTIDVAGQVKSGHGVYVLSTATSLAIESLDVTSNLIGQGSGTRCSVIEHIRGVIKKLTIRGSSESMQQCYYDDAAVGTVVPIEINIPDFTSTNGTRLLELQADANVNLGAVKMLNQTAAPIRVRNNKAVVITGDVVTTGATTIDVDIIEVVTLNTRLSGKMRVDGAKLSATPIAGDSFWNTNAAWAGGSGTSKVGQYVYSGSAWVKLYGSA